MRGVGFRWVLAATCAATLTVAGTTMAGAAPERVTLTDTSPTEGLVDNGAVPDDTPISENIYLAVKDPAALAGQAKAASDPNSPGYAQFIGRDRIRETHQLDRAQLDQVRDWLRTAGLKVEQPNWRVLKASGTIGQLNAAFDVRFHDFTYPPESKIKGHYLTATTDLSVPAELGDIVLGVGADQFIVLDPDEAASTQTSTHRARVAAEAPAECSKYWGERSAKGVPQANGATPPLALCGYTPRQLRQAYGLDSTDLTGAGETVALLATPADSLEQDMNTWADHVGTPRLHPGQLSVVPTPDGSPANDPVNGGFSANIEATIDAEAVHGMAPDANIVTIGRSSADGANLLDSMLYAMDHTDASIVSSSIATVAPPGLRKAYEQAYQEGALQGVGFYFCAGDGGFQNTDKGDDWLSTSSSSGWETSVGGTSIAIGPDGKRQWETGWGDPTSALSADGSSWEAKQGAGGTGGGRSLDEPQPWYQQGVVPDDYAVGKDGKKNRVGPDVGMDADPLTGMLVGGTPLDGSPTTDPGTWRYLEHGFGGTSLSTPLFAGVQALAQQGRGGRRFGFANPLLYQHAGSSAFGDVTGHRLPDGNPPTAVNYPSNGNGGKNPVLNHFLATQLPEPEDGLHPPEVGPGFDTETGLGVPGGDYPSSFGSR
ncbi:S53 family peptidase [Amycolatopsis ultiminotia]|uniref:S53 family peptidase n=1 Tax=Amycolatopsis ultiminotia TaxID=543629 RepID=A0ABP6XZD6_9PSEU